MMQTWKVIDKQVVPDHGDVRLEMTVERAGARKTIIVGHSTYSEAIGSEIRLPDGVHSVVIDPVEAPRLPKRAPLAERLHLRRARLART